VPVQLKQLRIMSTVLLAFAVAQAGLGSGYLDNVRALLVAHATNAFAVLVLTILSAIFGFNLRRAGGPSWTFFLPATLVLMAGIQVTLGFVAVRGQGGVGIHVFWGVLYLCTVTVFCSYCWRLQASDLRTGRSAA
jgi:heme A synthase